MANLRENADRLKLETFGVEIEMYNITQEKAQMLIADYFFRKYGFHCTTGTGFHLHDHYIIDHRGRKWHCYSDASLSGNDAYDNDTCELATPVLHYDDIEELQEIVRMLRTEGHAKSDSQHGCGIHIHIGIPNDVYEASPRMVRNLVNVVANHQKIIAKAIGFSSSRASHYSRFISNDLVSKLNSRRPRTWDALKELHYDTLGGTASEKYNDARYYFLNLHAMWNKGHGVEVNPLEKGTVEFRCFEFHKSLHAGELKTWIQLCMAMVSYSKIVAYVTPHEVYDENEKYCMKNWLNNLGLMGDEFKTCRKLMMRRLEGDPAQRTPRTIRVDTLDDLDIVE
jgi:hypothetical protein